MKNGTNRNQASYDFHQLDNPAYLVRIFKVGYWDPELGGHGHKLYGHRCPCPRHEGFGNTWRGH